MTNNNKEVNPFDSILKNSSISGVFKIPTEEKNGIEIITTMDETPSSWIRSLPDTDEDISTANLNEADQRNQKLSNSSEATSDTKHDNVVEKSWQLGQSANEMLELRYQLQTSEDSSGQLVPNPDSIIDSSNPLYSLLIGMQKKVDNGTEADLKAERDATDPDLELLDNIFQTLGMPTSEIEENLFKPISPTITSNAGTIPVSSTTVELPQFSTVIQVPSTEIEEQTSTPEPTQTVEFKTDDLDLAGEVFGEVSQNENPTINSRFTLPPITGFHTIVSPDQEVTVFNPDANIQNLRSPLPDQNFLNAKQQLAQSLEGLRAVFHWGIKNPLRVGQIAAVLSIGMGLKATFVDKVFDVKHPTAIENQQGEVKPETKPEDKDIDTEIIDTNIKNEDIKDQMKRLGFKASETKGTYTTNAVFNQGKFDPETRSLLAGIRSGEAFSGWTKDAYNSGNFGQNEFDAKNSNDLCPPSPNNYTQLMKYNKAVEKKMILNKEDGSKVLYHNKQFKEIIRMDKDGRLNPNGEYIKLGRGYNIGGYQYFVECLNKGIGQKKEYTGDVALANKGLKRLGMSIRVTTFHPFHQDMAAYGIVAELINDWNNKPKNIGNKLPIDLSEALKNPKNKETILSIMSAHWASVPGAKKTMGAVFEANGNVEVPFQEYVDRINRYEKYYKDNNNK
jgi:hypothetical protein